MCKIYVWEVPHDMLPDKLLSHFSSYGEIEEGPLGFDRFTEKSKGFELFSSEATTGPRPSRGSHQRTLAPSYAAKGSKGGAQPAPSSTT
ncbi:hypothetical protein FH972_002034 [Carpinus fangiana]|uniref:RRM domain-containing protein n=1 Tax=Carpinus fangiana TaxID=176857 RepID=A0A5N6QGS8_9ROSI|nr:hypothetical protein FH972_002034 [Carpinus fangiana]